jgi:hypothetical protein
MLRVPFAKAIRRVPVSRGILLADDTVDWTTDKAVFQMMSLLHPIDRSRILPCYNSSLRAMRLVFLYQQNMLALSPNESIVTDISIEVLNHNNEEERNR